MCVRGLVRDRPLIWKAPAVPVKSRPMRIKAIDGAAGDGVFEAIVATYDVDSYGDRILPGAFADTLKAWKASGDAIPVYWSHRMDDPDFNIGHVLEAAERPGEGLWVKAQLDLDNPKAASVHRLMKGRRVTQFSFAYEVLDGGPVKSDGDSVFELRKLDLFEVGPTPIGVNQATELLDVKSLGDLTRELRAGRTLDTAQIAAVKAAHVALGAVLAASGPNPDDEAEARQDARTTAEEPAGAKAVVEDLRPAARRAVVLAELELLCS